MEFYMHIDRSVLLAIIPLLVTAIAGMWRLWYTRRMSKPAPAKDLNQQIAEALRAATGSKPENGEELLGSPELQKQLREAKAKDAARQTSKPKLAKQ